MSEREDRGRELRRRAQGRRSDELQARLAELDPEVATWADEFVFGAVWSREGLAFDERRLVAVTALAMLGNETQLRNYLHGALQDGFPKEKLREAIVMTVVYAGFPAAINSLVIWREVVEAHDRRTARP